MQFVVQPDTMNHDSLAKRHSTGNHQHMATIGRHVLVAC